MPMDKARYPADWKRIAQTVNKSRLRRQIYEHDGYDPMIYCKDCGHGIDGLEYEAVKCG